MFGQPQVACQAGARFSENEWTDMLTMSKMPCGICLIMHRLTAVRLLCCV